VLALLPNLALWAKGLVDNALVAAGTTAADAGLLTPGTGDIYLGMALFGGGAVLAGLVLGALATFVIDRQFMQAGAAALGGALFSFFGLLHAEEVQLNAVPAVSLGYLFMAAVFLLFALHQRRPDMPTEAEEGAPTADAVDPATAGAELLFVNGTLMRGLALHSNLDGAEFVEEVRTAPRYRLYSIGDVHPGMFEVEHDGVGVDGELYRVPNAIWRRVEASEPEGLYRGPVHLEDGRIVPGILFRRELATGRHPDISRFGGWRQYMAQGALGSPHTGEART
jgi:adenine/guanine/hypoxanthine permease